MVALLTGYLARATNTSSLKLTYDTSREARLAVRVEYEIINIYENKPEEKWPLGRSWRKWNDDIYMNNRYYIMRVWNGFN